MNWRTVGIFTAVIIAVLGGIFASTLWQKRQEDLSTKPLDELLPSRGEIPTEWVTGSSHNITPQKSGVIEGKKETYYKSIEGLRRFDFITLEFSVYRFLNVSSAKAYYDEAVTSAKSKGNYEEVAISGVFAYIHQAKYIGWGGGKEGVSIGVKSNIVFVVNVYTNNYSVEVENELIHFTNLLKNKMT